MIHAIMLRNTINSQNTGLELFMQNAPKKMDSADTPDWSRETVHRFWSPNLKLLRSIRRYQHWNHKKNPIARLFRKFYVVNHHFWSVATGADIPLNTKIGGGLLIPHPNGLVFHPEVEIGPNCLIFQQVTLGSNGKGFPRIGGHVDIGAGAKILGPITIGDHARIGANSVVINDVPSGVTVAGIPAKPISSSKL